MGRGVSLASAGLAGRASICGRVIAAPIQGRMPRECAGQGRATRFGAYSSHGGSLLAHRAAEVSVAGGRAKRPVRRRAARCVYGRMAGRRGSATIRHMGPFAVGRTCRTGAYRESMSIDAPIAEYLRENEAQACRCPDDAMPMPPSATGTNRERLSPCAFSLPAHGAANLTLYFGDSIGQCGI